MTFIRSSTDLEKGMGIYGGIKADQTCGGWLVPCMHTLDKKSLNQPGDSMLSRLHRKVPAK